MEETHAFQKMEENDLISCLEKISSNIPNKILKVGGYILNNNKREQLEIIIFKGYSSSTTHPIEIDLEKKVIEFSHFFTNFKLCKAPLIKDSDDFLKENKSPLFFLDQKNWD